MLSRSVFSIFLALVLINSAFATNHAASCNGCTYAQITTLAVQNYNSNNPRYSGQTPQYVYDLPGNKMYSFFVDGQTWRLLSNTSSVSASFGKYQNAVIANNGSEIFNETLTINIPSPISTNPDGSSHDNGYINAYDVLTVSSANYAVINCLSSFSCSFSFTNSNPVLDSALVEFVQQFKSSLLNFDGMKSMYTVSFPDGSQAAYKYDPDTQLWKIVPRTVYDSHHNLLNPLPGAPHQFNNSGGYEYDGPNIGHLYNVTIIQSTPYCAYLNWDGKTLTCFEVP